MKTIDETYTIKAPVAKVWAALTTAEQIDQWEAGPATFDLSVGGQFSLWGGDIHGTNTQIIPEKLLVQSWYGHDHPEREYKVTFNLNEVAGVTTVHLTHADIPDDEYDGFLEGWRDYYFDPVKALLES